MKDFEVLRDSRACIGTSGRGTLIGISGAELRKKFGPPILMEGKSDGKIRWLWILNGPSGIITIYDWKSSVPLKNIRQWNVGGHKPSAPSILGTALGLEWSSI